MELLQAALFPKLALSTLERFQNAAQTSKRYATVFATTRDHLRRYYAIEKRLGFVSHLDVELIMQSWSTALLDILRVKKTQIGSVAKGPVLLVGNHISYVDICVVMATKPVSFVAKAELRKWPIIGKAAEKGGIIFVKREDKSSRVQSIRAIKAYLAKTQGSLCIFPSGTTSLTEDKPWRFGPFQIAKQLNLPVQPFRLKYHPMRLAAYIDQDHFAKHLWTLLAKSDLSVTIELAEPFQVDQAEQDAQAWWQWSREPLLTMEP